MVQHAPPAVQAHLLPLRQQHTLLYFAQQQQRVHFTPQNGGGVSLCHPPTRSLREETTPLPRVVAELYSLLSSRGVLYVEELEKDVTRSVSDYAKGHIIAYFGTLRRFLFQHEFVFRLSVLTSPTTVYEETISKEGKGVMEEEEEDGKGLSRPRVSDGASTTASGGEKRDAEVSLSLPPLPASLPRPGIGFMNVANPFQHNAADADADARSAGARLDHLGFPAWLASRDLAVQLEDEAKIRDNNAISLHAKLEALEELGSRTKVRKVRRRLAAMANPDSPFSDPAVLLDAILRYLPLTRHISLRALLATLPISMRDFLPNDPIRLFRNAPDKVQLFEYRQKNHLRVMRAGQPPPDGRLRMSYSEEELLHLIAAELVPGQAKNAMTIYGSLPYGGRESVRLQHRHLVSLVERYPANFVVVYPDTKKEKKHMARISLLQPPPTPRNWSEDDPSTLASLTPEELDAVEKADRAALLSELPPDLRQSIHSGKSE